MAAIEAAQAIKSPAAEGIALSNLGVVYINRREWERAKQSLQKSLVIRQTIGDRPGEGDIYLRLATVEEIQGDFASARQHSERAVELFREMHNRIDEMFATLRMCDMLRELGQWAQAVGLSEKALAEFQRQGHHAYYESMALNQIGMTRLLQCRFDDTVKLSSASVRCSMSCGDVVGEALGHLAAGMAYAELRSIEQARSELERSRDLFELRKDFIMGARVRLALAVLAPDVDPAGSTALAVEAREVLEDSGDVVGAALAHAALGSIHASGGDAAVARHHYAEALAVLSGFRAARVRVKVAELELGRGNHREAIAALDEARRNSLGTDDDWTRREIRKLRAEVRGREMSVDE
jgi:tetratricopeptide (TPR) repeat protein